MTDAATAVTVTSERPRALAVRASDIPAALRAERRWVLWKFERISGEWTKVPYMATAPHRRASSTDSGTWGTFAEALAAYDAGTCDGIGSMLGDGWAGIDLDRCCVNGVILPDAQAIIARCPGAYGEISPSETGVKIFGRAEVIGFEIRFHKGGALARYQKRRFFAVTGCALTDPPGDPTADLSALMAAYCPAPPPPVEPSPTLLADDDDLIVMAHGASNGDKFKALWAGDSSAYASPSEADLALCCLLAFWTGKDLPRMDRLFRASGLLRNKWDRDDYRDRTLAKAVSLTTEGYASAVSEAAVIDPPVADPPRVELVPATYVFRCVVPNDHFLGQWIAYASARTDASHEYHEAVGLALLASATPTVRARLAPYPNGLPTNLYLLLLGDSTTSRKTTSKDLGKDAQFRAIPGSLSADQFSPEGFIEQLAERPSASTTLYVDEFGETLDKLPTSKNGRRAGFSVGMTMAKRGSSPQITSPSTRTLNAAGVVAPRIVKCGSMMRSSSSNFSLPFPSLRLVWR